MAEKKEWTFMVYMAGDNNLSIDMAYALQEIRDAAKYTQGKINLLVYYDSSLRDVPTTYYDFSNYDNPVQIRSRDAEKKFQPPRTIEPLNENSAKMYSIINFVDWCVNKVEYQENGEKLTGRKADNYALIFSGHSFGFQEIGLFKDESSNYYMTMDKLVWALERMGAPEEDITDGKGVVLGKKLDILGFDSCVMSMMEVGCAFHNSAQIMLASEGTIPNAGWTYRKLLEETANGLKGGDLQDLAVNFVNNFITIQNQFTIGGVSVDLAAWNLANVPSVVSAFGTLSENLLECFEDRESTIYKQLKRILLQVHWNCQSYMYEQNVDLMDFCRLLYEEVDSLEKEFDGSLGSLPSKLKDSCVEVMKRLDKCIILSGFCGGNCQYSNGMSLFFPWTFAAYLVSVKSYTKLYFYEKTEAGKKWNEFLLKYLIGVTLRQDRNTENNNALRNNVLSFLNPVIHNHEHRIPPNIADRIPPNIADRIPADLAARIPPNIADRIPPNIADRIPPNIADRIPPNIADRIFSGMMQFMAQFTEMKNIDRPWFISGFTKDLKKKRSAGFE